MAVTLNQFRFSFSFAPKAGEKLNVCMYADTGYRVDHVPYLPAYVDNLTPAVSNIGVIEYNHLGIGSIRVACPADYAQYIDYCRITWTAREMQSTEDYTYKGDTVVTSDISGDRIVKAYYFVTGFSTPNRGVIEFTLMMDAWTTLRGYGASLASGGGRMTRCPVYDKQVYNTLQEPYTPQYPYIHDVASMSIDPTYEVTYVNSINDDALLSTKDGPLTIIMSPYRLPQSKNDDTPSITAEHVSTNSDTGSSTVIQYPTAVPAEKYTDFQMSAASGQPIKSSYQGVRAYDAGNTECMKRVSTLFAAGISNAVMDSYIIPGGVRFDNGGAAIQNRLTGKHFLKTYTPKTVAYSASDKTTFLNRWVTIFSPSSGESQTFALYDLELDSSGNVQIDVWVDPMPSGGIYARMRQKGETASEVKPSLPGSIKSKEWRKAALAITLNGMGVEQGQTWKSAELGIDRAVAEASAAATAAQYDFSAGNGYLLRQAGNEYGMRQLGVNINTQTALHGNALSQNTLSQVNNAIQGVTNTMQAFGNAGEDQTLVGWVGGIAGAAAGAVTGAVGIGLQREAENISYTGQQMGNQISREQMSEQGEYQRSLTMAQANAATAVSNASLEKINLQTSRLSKCPETTVMGYEKTGILQANPTEFYIIETRMDARDIEGMKESLQMFGETVYLPTTDAAEHIESAAASGKWNFVKIDGIGQQFLEGLTVKAPAWLRQGFCDQLSAGIWIYKE